MSLPSLEAVPEERETKKSKKLDQHSERSDKVAKKSSYDPRADLLMDQKKKHKKDKKSRHSSLDNDDSSDDRVHKSHKKKEKKNGKSKGVVANSGETSSNRRVQYVSYDSDSSDSHLP